MNSLQPALSYSDLLTVAKENQRDTILLELFSRHNWSPRSLEMYVSSSITERDDMRLSRLLKLGNKLDYSKHLGEAIKALHPRCVKVLIDAKACVNSEVCYGGKTPLQLLPKSHDQYANSYHPLGRPQQRPRIEDRNVTIIRQLLTQAGAKEENTDTSVGAGTGTYMY
jgi:hypothetical protein